MSFFRKKRTIRRKPYRRAPVVERLEERNLLTATPFGATEVDTAEFLLGNVYVSVVAFESDGSRDPNLEDWNDEYRDQLKTKIEQGLQWWVDTLEASFPNNKHELNFEIDFTHLDTPIQTGYEPINRPSFDFQSWTADFYNVVGFNNGDFSFNSWAFNHAQREAHEADWAYTIFVVNDQNDSDGRFAPGGFDRAFAFSGGRFFVTPAGRPNSTFAHETGHMFWGKDEYRGGGNYTSVRGYYNAQNLNAWDNPIFLSGEQQRSPSIMDRGACEESAGLLCLAFQDHTSSDSSFAMVGWLDSDSDGIFDVLDVPLTLEGAGGYDAAQSEYRFVGTSSVQTIPNLNSSGTQNDISTNHVSQAQFRIDGGDWLTAQRYDDFTANLDLSITLAVGQQIEIRTIDDSTGLTSPVFSGNTNAPTSTLLPGITGFVWNDKDSDGIYDAGEPPLAERTVQLVDQNGTPLQLRKAIEPDLFPSSTSLLNSVIPEVTLSGVGSGVSDNSVFSLVRIQASTGGRVFASFSQACGGTCPDWTDASRRLRMDFTTPVTTVSVDAIARNLNDLGRLEIYDTNDNLLARYTTNKLAAGQFETMTLSRPTADIAYALAGAHDNRTILLDNLQFGPQATAFTDTRGMYQLSYLEPATYTVQIVSRDGDRTTAPAFGQQMVTLAAGQAIGDVRFGVSTDPSPWQNPSNRFDVNNDGVVSPNDVLQVINNLNLNGPYTLTNESVPPYYDVDGNRVVTALDVLHVINELNRTGDSEGESVVSPSSTPPSVVPFAEAEASPQPTDAVPFATPVDNLTSRHSARLPIGPRTADHAVARTLPSPSVTDRNQSRPGAVSHRQADKILPRDLDAHDQFMQRAAENDERFLSSDLDDELVDLLAASLLGHL
jgi:hypothetical protein